MKNKNLVSIILMGVFFIFTISCENDDDNTETTAPINVTDIVLNEDVEAAQNEIDSFTDDVVDNESIYFDQITSIANNTNASTRLSSKKRHIPEGATVTKIDNSETNIRITVIDFGDGVTKNDNVFKGKIILTYEKTEDTKNVTQTFENFYINDKNITGENTHKKVKSNENGNRQTVKEINIKIVWKDGTEGTRVGTKTIELIEGAGDKNHKNNVYKITGNWSSTYVNGATLKVEITKPLIRKIECRGKIVEGIKSVTKNEDSVTVDFGDGNCPEGNERDIQIKKRDGKKIIRKVRS